MRTLQIIGCAYRCILEEQDDPAIWITHAMKSAGGDFDVLLCANAVNYAVKGQDASGLSVGGLKQSQPPQIDHDIGRLLEKDIAVYILEEDSHERGLSPSRFIDGIKAVSRKELAQLFDEYEQIWHW